MKDYPEEYKIETVRRYFETGESRQKTAKELGIPFTTLRGWIKKYMNDVKVKDKSKKVKIDYEFKFKELEKVVLNLEEENLILKKSIGIFTRNP